MTAKADLQHYLLSGRDALLARLDGVSVYDARRPLTPTHHDRVAAAARTFRR